MMHYELLARSASSFPNRPAVAEGGRVLTYSELHDAVDAMSCRFQELGLSSNSIVAIQLPNSVEFVVALLAVGKLGATALPLDPALKAEEVGRYSARAGAGVLLCRPSGPGLPEDGESVWHHLSAIDTPSGGLFVATRVLENPRAIRDSQQNVFLLLSSGTEGLPKIVPRTAAQVEGALQVFGATLPHSQDDRVLGVLPFFHSFGLLNVLLSTLARGAALYVESFSPRRTAATIESEQITVLPATPLMFRLLAETDFSRVPEFSSVRLAISAGSALSFAVAQRFEEKFGAAIAQSYGTTESGPAALSRTGQPQGGAGCVGEPYVGVSVEIWDSSGNPLGPGQEGEVAIKSPANALCYVGEPKASAATFRRGYVLTGDIGHRDKAGRLFVLGRNRPMLNVAGKKVAPHEVEACLRSHPCVAEVLVVGADGPEGSESVRALVVPAASVTAIELREYCGKRLADFKVPRQIIFAKDISRGAMGKPTCMASDQTE